MSDHSSWPLSGRLQPIHAGLLRPAISHRERWGNRPTEVGLLQLGSRPVLVPGLRCHRWVRWQGVCHLEGVITEGVSGIHSKQARRTGMAGPLGQMFDHGMLFCASFMPGLCDLTLASISGCDSLNTTVRDGRNDTRTNVPSDFCSPHFPISLNVSSLAALSMLVDHGGPFQRRWLPSPTFTSALGRNSTPVRTAARADQNAANLNESTQELFTSVSSMDLSKASSCLS